MKVPTYTSEGQLQSTMRIPDTRTGGAAVGEAISGLGSSVMGLGRSIQAGMEQQQAQQERVNVANEKRAAFDADRVFLDYQTQTANVETTAALGAGDRGSGLHDTGIKYLEEQSAGINGYIQQLRETGYHAQAAELEQRKRIYDFGISAKLRKDEFIANREVEVKHLATTSDQLIANITADPNLNDAQVREQIKVIESSTYTTEIERKAAVEGVLKAALTREAEVRFAGNPGAAADALGLPNPTAGEKNTAIQYSQAAGVPPSAAIAVIQMESGFNSGAVNGQHVGLFQMSPEMQRKYGGTGVDAGIRMLADNRATFVENNGREPTLGEYGIMQLAPNGVNQLVQMDPNTPITAGLAAAGFSNPGQVMLANQGLFTGVDTVGEWRQRMEQHMQTKLQEAGGANAAAITGLKTAGTLTQNQGELEQYRGKVSYSLGPKRPNKPQEYVTLNAAKAVTAVNPGYSLVVTSGQENAGEQHGADRHPTGRAADIKILDENGVPLTYNRNPTAFKQALTNLAAAGFKGIGYYGPDNTMIHVDDVRVGQWGPSKSKDSLPPDIAQAIAAGRGQNVAGLQGYQIPTQGTADPRYAQLDFKSREKVYNDTVAQQKAANTANQSAANDAYAAHKGALDLGIQTGSIGIQDIMSDPILNDSDMASYIKTLKDSQSDATSFAEAMQSAQVTGTQVDFSDSKTRKGEDQMWSQTVPDDWWKSSAGQVAAQQFMNTTGHIPGSVVKQMSNSLNTGDVNNLAGMLAVTAAMPIEGGLRGHDGTDKLQKLFDRVNYLREYQGLDAVTASKQAAQEAVQANDPEFIRKRDMIQKSETWKNATKNLVTLDGAVENLEITAPDGTAYGMSDIDPTSDQNMAYTWTQLVQEYLDQTLTLDGAEAAKEAAAYANKKISQYYTVAKIDPDKPPVAIRNHPAQFVNALPNMATGNSIFGGVTQSDFSWIDTQLTGVAADQITKRGLTDRFDMANLDVFIAPDMRTEQEANTYRAGIKAGKKLPSPSYQVKAITKDGTPITLPFRYAPDEQAAMNEVKIGMQKRAEAARALQETPPYQEPTMPGRLPMGPKAPTADDIIRENTRKQNEQMRPPKPAQPRQIQQPAQQPVQQPRRPVSQRMRDSSVSSPMTADDIIRENMRRQNQRGGVPQ